MAVTATVAFDLNILPLELWTRIEDHFAGFNLTKLRLLSKYFAVKYKHHANCCSPSMPTKVEAILHVICHSLYESATLPVETYGFLYTTVWASCMGINTDGTTGRMNSEIVYKLLSNPYLVRPFSNTLSDAKKIAFKRYLMNVFKCIDRFHVKCCNVPALDVVIEV